MNRPDLTEAPVEHREYIAYLEGKIDGLMIIKGKSASPKASKSSDADEIEMPEQVEQAEPVHRSNPMESVLKRVKK